MKQDGRANLPADPLQSMDLGEFGSRFRTGELTALSITEQYLARIAALEPRMQAFVQVAEEHALNAARGVDRMRAAGNDLGPLMGVPVTVKDLFTVQALARPRLGSA